MRLIPSLCLAVTSLFFIGCEKDYSLETGQDPPVAGEGLLINAKLQDPVSEIEYTYEYNSANLPIRNLFTATAAGLSADGMVQTTRDAAGKLIFSKLVISSGLSSGSDTINYDIVRGANGKIGYVILQQQDITGLAGYDSIAYTYNGNSKLSGYVVFFVEYGTGVVEPIQRFDLTYTGNNVTKLTEYELNGSLASAVLVETITFTYDDKPAARVLTEDEYIANLAPINNFVPSVNNCLNYSRDNAQDPDENVITEYNYVYGTTGKPVSAVVTTIRPGLGDGKATLTFTYR
jgi:hypothetical protein